ncbi:MAG: sulfotransferase domain-containing protein, partial [Nocardioides sp.]|nr:sulfotransferase domain-containing protein [Nocardioides sp.]
VILLRDPVARAYSSFQYMRARGFEPAEDFLEAVAQESERLAAHWHHLWHYTRMSMYADAVAAVQAAVPADQVGIWFYEDLDRDHDATIAEVTRFLGLAPTATDDGPAPRVNISGTPRSRLLHRGLLWVTRHEAPRSAVKAVTTYRFRERVRSLALRRGDVSEQARASLAPVFAEDVSRLRKLLPDSSVGWLADGGAP